MSSHAILSPSSSKRWLSCTPSARLESTIPEPPKKPGQFDFSAEGTLGHSLAETKLRYQLNMIGSEEYDKEIELIKSNPLYSEELETAIDTYVVYIRSQIGEGDQVFLEQRVDLTDFVPEGFGSADCIIINEHKIRVFDLKAGRGIPVSAVNNSQLRLYALGAYSKYSEVYPNIKEVEYTIVQPRLDSITSDHTTVAKLLDWGNFYVKKKAKRAWVGTGEFTPGEHCQFCRAKAQCKARADFNNEIAKLEFRAPALLSDEEIDLVYSRAGSLTTWANDVLAFVTERAVKENIVPKGYKLTTTKTHRKIGDEALAASALIEKGFNKEDIYKPVSLKSIAQLEKLGQKGQVASLLGDLIIRPDGEPKLVKDTNNVEEDFK
jgi:hypothetical protein